MSHLLLTRINIPRIPKPSSDFFPKISNFFSADIFNESQARHKPFNHITYTFPPITFFIFLFSPFSPLFPFGESFLHCFRAVFSVRNEELSVSWQFNELRKRDAARLFKRFYSAFFQSDFPYRPRPLRQSRVEGAIFPLLIYCYFFRTPSAKAPFPRRKQSDAVLLSDGLIVRDASVRQALPEPPYFRSKFPKFFPNIR